VVICLEQGADLHMAQLMPLPLTVSCFSKSQIGFTFLVPVHMVVPEKGPLNGCVCVCVVYAGEMGPHDTALEREHFGRSDDQTVPHRRSKCLFAQYALC